jgi:tetratricopeptide (TPR) repeat protein
MKCDVCGTESDFEASFIRQRRSFRSTNQTLCPACWTRRRNSFEGWYQVAVLVGGIIGYVLLWLDPWSAVGRFLTTLFLIDLFLILSIVPHELGHAMAGRLAGWRVFAVVVGAGKQVVRFRLFRISFALHWLPVGGVTRLAPVDARWFRTRRFFIFLAGPAVNAAIVAAIIMIWRDSWHNFGLMGLPRAARLCLWANLCVLAFNLWPRDSKALNMATDGKQLLRTFSRKPENWEELQAARYVLEAVWRRDEYLDRAGALNWCDQGLALFPHNVHLLNLSGVLCLDQQNYRRAREIFLQLLAQQTKPNATRYMILNNLAYADALAGDPDLLPEGDAYSNEAHKAAPWVPAFMGTRGTVLVAMGQIEAGIKLLEQAFEKALSPRSKAENACHLAIANARSGNRGKADQYLKLARQLDSECRLTECVQAELQKA